MPTGTIILLGAFAGLTIYLGLPLAFLKKAPQSLKAFLSMLATGVLLFLLYDVIGKATEPINGLIEQVRTQHTGGTTLSIDIFLFIFGLLLGLIGLVYFNKHIIARLKSHKPAPTGGGSAAASSAQLALAGVGANELAMTEVTTQVVPSASRVKSVSWKFIFLAGLIGGGPTFLGTLAGIAFHSTGLFIFCLTLAAGAIIYVVAELLGVAKRFKAQDIVMWGLLVGFLLGYVTDLVVTYAGA